MQATRQNHITQYVTHASLDAQLNCIPCRLKTGIKKSRVLNSSPTFNNLSMVSHGT